MTEDKETLLDRIQKLDGGDFQRELAGSLLQKLMEPDEDNLIRAAPYARSDERATLLALLVGVPRQHGARSRPSAPKTAE